eukprot:Skav215794  [mRNA]  locus=scaffold3885:28349:31884:+ [translate_table: standard]
MELIEGVDGTVALKDEGRHRNFRFNAVIGSNCSQQEVWEMSRIDAVVKKVALGFHATIFAYGQTGTGKTHTMEGFTYEHHSVQLGIVPRAVMALFERVEAMKGAERSDKGTDKGAAEKSGKVGEKESEGAEKGNEKVSERGERGETTSTAQADGTGVTSTSCVVRLSFLQIYNEKIFDLLNPSITVAQREQGGRGDEFAGLRLRWDAAKRHFFVENLFQYECSSAEEALQYYQQGIQNKQAGPQEAVNVNQSLFVLRRVITALSKRDGREAVHIPYRESKLTSLLQNSLGGNSYLVMFACLAPSERQDDENLSTLQYASQAAQIRNQPVVNLDPKDQLIQQLEIRLTVAHDYLRRALHLSELPEDLLEEERCACRGAGARLRRPPRRPTVPKAKAMKESNAVRSARDSTGASKLDLERSNRSASNESTGPTGPRSAVASRLPKPPSPQAKTWTGTEQRWSFEEKPEKQKSHDTVSESSRESSKSRAKNLQRKGSGDANSSTSLSRIVRGRNLSRDAV